MGESARVFPWNPNGLTLCQGSRQKAGHMLVPQGGGQFWQTGRDIIRHEWPPARPSIPVDEIEQKAGWLAKADTRVPDLGSTQKPQTRPPEWQPMGLVALWLLLYCGAPQMDWL